MEIYADYAAAAPLRPEARAAVLEALDAGLGNPSSVHDAGTRARARLEAAREEIAAALDVRIRSRWSSRAAPPRRTTSRSLGVADARARPHLAVPATEHASVLGAGAGARRARASPDRLADDADGPYRRAYRRGGGARSAVGRARERRDRASCRTCSRSARRRAGARRARARRRGAGGRLPAARRRGARRRPADPLEHASSADRPAPARSTSGAASRSAPLHRGGPQEQGLRAGTENVAGDRRLRDRAGARGRRARARGARLATLRDRLRAATRRRVAGRPLHARRRRRRRAAHRERHASRRASARTSSRRSISKASRPRPARRAPPAPPSRRTSCSRWAGATPRRASALRRQPRVGEQQRPTSSAILQALGTRAHAASRDARRRRHGRPTDRRRDERRRGQLGRRRARCVEQGFDVVGVSMQLSATPAATVRAGQGCCSLEDFRDARRVADAPRHSVLRLEPAGRVPRRA